MSRSSYLVPRLATLALIVLAAACATDSPTAPLAPVMSSEPALAANSGGTTYIGDTIVVTFVINPSKGATVQIGDHKLKIPANTVCDPATSTYGPTQWNSPCTLLSAPLSMAVKSWKSARGLPRMDFSRDLRFVKSKQGELPTLYFMDKKSVSNPWARILYCATPTSPCVDESLLDSDLVTRTDASNGYLYRFIKHFSGYNVWA